MPSTLNKLVFLGATLASAGGQAQEVKPAAAAAPDNRRVPLVEVRGDAAGYDPRRDDTASKVVVNRADIVRYGDLSVLDVMKRIPGVTVNGGALQLRGLGRGYTQVLINGERAPGGFSIDSVSPDTIERIEVMRSANAEYSTQSIAGTINIVLRKDVSKTQRELKLGLGKSQVMGDAKVTLQLSDRLDQFSYSIPVSVSRYIYRRPVVTTETDRAIDESVNYAYITRRSDDGGLSVLNIAPRLNWTLAAGDTLASQTFFNVNRNRYGAPYRTELVAGPPQVPPLVKLSNESLNVYLRTDLTWMHQFGASRKMEIRAGVSGGNFGGEITQRSDEAARQPAAERLFDTDTRDRAATTTGKYSAPLGQGHAMAAGWDAGIARNSTANVDVDGELRLDQRFQARVARLALYGQDEWTVAPNWSVSMGLRWEGIETHTEGSDFAPAASSASVLSPLLQTLIKIPNNKNHQFRLGLTRTYSAPDIAQLIPRRTVAINNSATNPDQIGNPGLKPELALGLDASYEYTWVKGALFSLSTSARRISDHAAKRLERENGRWTAIPINDGEALVRTVEMETRFPLASLAANAPPVDVRFSLNWNRSRVSNVPGPNNRLAQQLPFSASSGIDYRKGAVSFGGTFVYKAAADTRLSATDYAYSSTRRELDVYALWKIDPSWQVRMSISNFLQQEWATDNTYIGQAGAHNTHNAYSGTPWGRLTLERRF